MTDTLKKILSVIFIFAVLFTGIVPSAYAESEVDSEKLITAILKEELDAAGVTTVQALLDGEYTDGAGSLSDWMVFSIIQYRGSKYDYSSYAKALAEYVDSHNSYTAATADRYAILFAAVGKSSEKSEFITDALRNSFEDGGIMAHIYGLHLLNNGFSASSVTASKAVSGLLSLQHDDGGWGLGSTSDVDVTAMTLQALARHKSEDDVKTAVSKALTYLSDSQQSDGSYMSYGDKSSESAAQVTVALTALGINPLTDSRFTKGGVSVVDSMLSFRASDRGYTHKAGGAYNITATSQVLYALVSLYRYENNMGSLYSLDITEKTSSATKAATTKAASSGSGAAIRKTTSAASEAASSAAASAATSAAVSSASAASTFSGSRVRTTAERHVFGRKTAETAEEETTAEGVPEAQEEESGTVPADETEVTFAPVTEDDDEGLEFSFGNIIGENKADASQSEESSDRQKKTVSVKTLIIIIVWLAAFAAILVLIGTKKKKISNYVIVVAVAALLTGALAVSDIRTAGDYYGEEETSSAGTITVTMSIDCNTVAGRGDEEITPSDGVILAPTEFTLSEGSTAYDCLIAASKKYKIQIDDSTATLSDHSNAYISGINYLYEFDYGELSGWMFSVNGDFGDVGCGSCTLSDGDVIEWQYTTDMGDDLG